MKENKRPCVAPAWGAALVVTCDDVAPAGRGILLAQATSLMGTVPTVTGVLGPAYCWKGLVAL